MQIRDFITLVHNETYPSTEFYTATLQFDCREITNPNYVERLCALMDTINVFVDLGWAEWATISEKDTYWTSVLDSAAYYYTCDSLSQLPTAIPEIEKSPAIDIYPNPAESTITIQSNTPISAIALFDLTGREILYYTISSTKASVDITHLSPGTYIIKVCDVNGLVSTQKLIRK